MAHTLRLHLVQLAAGTDVKANLTRIRALLAAEPEISGTAETADLIVLPESCLCFGSHAAVRGAARSLAAWQQQLAPLARKLRAVTVFGGVPVLRRTQVLNSSLVFGAAGELLARYDKIHLFQLDPGQPGAVDETTLYAAGSSPVSFVLQGWKIGLTICYDLRFPELFRAYAPADLILCSAAFARETGVAHWQLLLRARAIENQCYIAGAGLCGRNPDTGFVCYGHSLVAGPWGELVVQAGRRDERVLTAELTRERLAEVRRRLPALAHRRLD